MKPVIVSIDPGAASLGCAAWDRSEWLKFPYGPNWQSRVPRPVKADAFEATRKGSIEDKAEEMAACFRAFICPLTVRAVHCEKMEFRPNARGVAAIADVLAVAFACGRFAEIANAAGATFHFHPVSKWKGQLSKSQVVTRCLKRWGFSGSTDRVLRDGVFPSDLLTDPAKPSHDWDAVGIGLFAMGAF